MNINSFIIKQVFRHLNISASARKQLEIAATLSDVDGRGFPRDLIQLNAPMIARGVLNFAILQMNRDWIYPYWVHRQLDPKGPGYIPRSQNPLLINMTHRNWTAIGSTHGFYEAIVDPRGLMTPLPREWSVDVWLVSSKGIFFPSLGEKAEQYIDRNSPNIRTLFTFHDIRLELECFVHNTRRGVDVVFHRTTVVNTGKGKEEGYICLAIRPFNPEGVAPVESIEFKSPRIAYVNNAVGVVFAEEPDGVICSNGERGDVAQRLMKAKKGDRIFENGVKHVHASCKQGLTNAVAGFKFELQPGEVKQVHCSAALGTDQAMLQSPVKQTWRVSFDRRQTEQRARWRREIDQGAHFTIANKDLQNLFDASRLTLLQFHDSEFISPGPYTYHTFWFRDAAVMLSALDVLGYQKRTGQVFDVFTKRLTPDGFFSGPDGEWDSNGAVIQTVYRHYELYRSELWLRDWYPVLVKAANWIKRMRRKTRDTTATVKGLMPKSLSAEHLGMVDQYYWDSFWSLAGLKCMEKIAAILGKKNEADEYRKEVESFENDIFLSFEAVERKIGVKVIPASPSRPFDEGAIGSICSIYPLQLFDAITPHPINTLHMLADRYVDDRGFFHPLIHSGYNPYLTLHIAHAFLLSGNVHRAWKIAETVFKQASSTYTYPEAIHPATGGGTMGDGHHGWAAAEIIMFIRNCLFREKGNTLELFGGNNGQLIRRGEDCVFRDIPTSFGKVGVRLKYTSANKCTISFSSNFFKRTLPEAIELHVPFEINDYVTGNREFLYSLKNEQGRSLLRVSPALTNLYVTMK